MVRAPALHAGGRRFDPCLAHQGLDEVVIPRKAEPRFTANRGSRAFDSQTDSQRIRNGCAPSPCLRPLSRKVGAVGRCHHVLDQSRCWVRLGGWNVACPRHWDLVSLDRGAQELGQPGLARFSPHCGHHDAHSDDVGHAPSRTLECVGRVATPHVARLGSLRSEVPGTSGSRGVQVVLTPLWINGCPLLVARPPNPFRAYGDPRHSTESVRRR